MTKEKRCASSKACQVSAKKLKTTKPQSNPVVDEKGHLVCDAGTVIMGRYNIEVVLGEGSYGRVVRVKDMDTLERKALKVFKNDERDLQKAHYEIRVLQRIAAKDPNETSLCIKMLDWFEYHNHACIAFDAFGMSIFDFMEHNNFEPYSLDEVRHIGYQLCHAVKFLHSNGITHNDIKPENLLFVDSSTITDSEKNCGRRIKSTEIRLIDFGGATCNRDPRTSIITTCYYRAPEVMLRLERTQACDSWSIGCTLFELCSAGALFPTDDDVEHLRLMEELLGPIPHRMASKSRRKYFIDGKLNCKLKVEEDFLKTCDKVKEWLKDSKDRELSNLIKQMLTYEPTQRITLEQAVNHLFFDNLLPHQKNITKNNNNIT